MLREAAIVHLYVFVVRLIVCVSLPSDVTSKS